MHRGPIPSWLAVVRQRGRSILTPCFFAARLASFWQSFPWLLASLVSLMRHRLPLSQPSSHTLVLDGLGKGAAPLDGPWQFHLGDDPAWADPTYDDSHWEQITAEKPWGMQGHANYSGFAWYRRAVSITPLPESHRKWLF